MTVEIDTVTIETADSIGWYFIQSYYSYYHKNINQLFKLYDKSASLYHGDIPEISKDLIQAHGTDAIKAVYKNHEKTNNKIIVVNADIQLSVNNSILIVVTGEWSKNGSSYYQFNQTFILCKGINDSTYDIANDILRFIDYEFKHDLLVEKEAVEPEIEAEKVENGEAEKTSEAAEATTASESPAPVAATPAVSESPAPVPETTAAESPAPVPAATTETVKEPESEPEQSGPISWAALAATAKDKSPVPKPSTPAKSPSTTVPVPAKKPTSPAAINGKYKKEDWFPIYVRGCESLNEDELRNHLISNFGEIKFFKQSSNIALIDFVNGDAQKKALNAKKTIINGTTISLEVRESKNARKEKPKEKIDFKRKNDKKQLTKKK